MLGAYLLDLAPTTESRLGSLVKSAASTGGLGGGAIGAGLFLRFGPYPTRLVFVILTALFALLVLAVPVLPETADRVPGALAALRPQLAGLRCGPACVRRRDAVGAENYVHAGQVTCRFGR